LRHVSVMTRPAASRSLIRAHTLMDSEPLMTPESTGEARAALAARKTLRNGSDFFDLGGRSIEATVLAGRISAAPGIRVSMADLFKAPTAGNTDRQFDQMADARK
jgi:hypothetical protein